MTALSRDSANARILRTGADRRSVIKSMLFAGGAVVFAGYGHAPKTLAQDNIRLVHWYHQYGEEGTEEAVQRYAEQYTEENPNVEIEVVWQLGDYVQALNAALLTDEAPDVFEQGVPNLDQVRQNQIAPLDDLYTDEVRAGFNEVGLQAGTIEGSIYWVKMVDDTGTIYYHRSLLEEAGIEPPQSLDDLIAASQALDTGRQKGLFVGNDGGISALIGPLLWSAGGNFLNEELTAPAFNTERAAAAFTKLRELNETDSLLIGAPTDYWDPSAFIQNLTAMQWTGLWAMPQILAEVGAENFGVLPWPASDAEGTPSTFWGGWGECVFGQSQNLDAAKALVQWLWIDNTEIQEDWNLSYGFHVPPRTEIQESAEALQDPPASEVVGFLNDYGVVTPPLWTGVMGTALGDAVTNIVREGADAAEELAAAEATVQEELDRLLAG
ncbi:MAG: sugar ABC transporter substrate-binding protein [Chloroflexota bacterium]|jgi:multiple sugar transport system substrate-binding protein|nr:sugar ABC transporter substrate-binding protein [Chloroflexota bacterium]